MFETIFEKYDYKNIIYPTELEAVARINTAIRLGNAVETVEELIKPEAQLPIVYQTAASLYQSELFSLQLQGPRVRCCASDFSRTNIYMP